MSNEKEKIDIDLENIEFEDIGDPKAEFLKMLYKDGDHLSMITDLSPTQVNSHSIAISAEKLIKDEFGVDVEISQLIRQHHLKAISKKRGGRKEGISPWVESEKRRGFFARLSGGN